MNNRSVRAAIFDLDGTLINSILDIANCANGALACLEYPPHPVEAYKELVGDGLSSLARKVLPAAAAASDEMVSRFVSMYRERYAKQWNEASALYDGVEEALSHLEERCVKLAVLSNKKDEFTKLCVGHFLPQYKFREVYGERAGVPLKPHPLAALEIAESLGVEPAECMFVGDSEIDIATAHAAGMVSVGVLWGFRSREVLEEAGAQHLLVHPRDLAKLLP